MPYWAQCSLSHFDIPDAFLYSGDMSRCTPNTNTQYTPCPVSLVPADVQTETFWWHVHTHLEAVHCNSAAFMFSPISNARELVCVCVCVFHSVGTTFHQMRTRHVGWPGNKFLARLPSRLLAEGHPWRHNLICRPSSSSLPRSCSFCPSCPISPLVPHTHHLTRQKAELMTLRWTGACLPNPFLHKYH